MAYHVQADIRNGPTNYIGWFECNDFLAGKFEAGFRLVAVWPNTILVDKKGVDGGDLRSISDDAHARSFGLKIKTLMKVK